MIGVGSGVHDLQIGTASPAMALMRKSSGVPRNLAKIPAAVSFEQAAFTVLSSIALEGVRVTAPQLERVLVFDWDWLVSSCASFSRRMTR